jgi:hypothetical protein
MKTRAVFAALLPLLASQASLAAPDKTRTRADEVFEESAFASKDPIKRRIVAAGLTEHETENTIVVLRTRQAREAEEAFARTYDGASEIEAETCTDARALEVRQEVETAQSFADDLAWNSRMPKRAPPQVTVRASSIDAAVACGKVPPRLAAIARGYYVKNATGEQIAEGLSARLEVTTAGAVYQTIYRARENARPYVTEAEVELAAGDSFAAYLRRWGSIKEEVRISAREVSPFLKFLGIVGGALMIWERWESFKDAWNGHRASVQIQPLPSSSFLSTPDTTF